MVKSVVKSYKCYSNNPKIHHFGNNNYAMSLLSPIMTIIIDTVAFNGRNIRYDAANLMKERLELKDNSNMLDIGCGVGISTRLILKVYPNANMVAIDTSKEMIHISEQISHVKSPKFKKIQFLNTDSHTYLRTTKKVDCIFIMFLLHEVPQYSTRDILRQCQKKTKNICIVDISETYSPSNLMLGGEPYVKDYQKNIQSNIVEYFPNAKKVNLVEGQVTMWYS
jgi:ubiquinone/menaquinone biosynthesis C-methylase UbiE